MWGSTLLEANPQTRLWNMRMMMMMTPDLLQGQTQVRTKLAEVQGGPVESRGTGRRQRPNADSAVRIQSPQSITTGSQMGQLHLSTQKAQKWTEPSGTSSMSVNSRKNTEEMGFYVGR